jgi:type II secretory pathway pseudopilin PulG
MPQPNKPFSSPLPSSRSGTTRCRASSARGVALLILMMVLTILLISLTVALPDVYTAGQREREEELIFRGNEYARAIMLYHRQFNRFPATVEDLMKKTNGYRFLRHAYRDPMTRSGKWRFIHANAAGVVFDSKTLTPPTVKNPGQNASGAQSQDMQNQAAENPNTPGENPQSPTSTTGNEVKGAFIVGVASTSKHKSIRILDNHDSYDEWEFLGVATTPTGAAGAQPGATPTGGQPGNQLPGMQTGASNPSNPQP